MSTITSINPEESKSEEGINDSEEVEKEVSKEKQKQLDHIRELSDRVFKGNGRCCAQYGEDCFSGDGACLFTLVEFPDKSQEIIKLAWGEFSRETFQSAEYPEYQKCPFDLYVVDQVASYFHYGDSLKDVNGDFVKYLRKYPLLVARQGHVTTSSRYDHSGKGWYEHSTYELRYDPEPIKYEDLMRDMRNLMLRTGNMAYNIRSAKGFEVGPEGFATFLDSLPKDETSLGKMLSPYKLYDWYRKETIEPIDIAQGNFDEERKKQHIHAFYANLIWDMGVSNIKDVTELISKFDRDKLEFVS